MLVSTGERISNALVRDGDPRPRPRGGLAHRLAGRDRHRRGHTKAKIVEVRAQRIHEALERDEIVLVAGFQGVSTRRTT